MRLLFLYGPPAVGKLSVAHELVSLTGFRLFHNHLTIAPVAALFPRGSEPFNRLVQELRRTLIAEAAHQGVDLIFTFVYVAGLDEDIVQELIAPVHAHGGQALFVQLTCARDELLARVQHESRRAYGKLMDHTVLAELLTRRELEPPIPFGESLQLDTTSLTPAEAAGRIVAHYGLPLTT